MGPQRVGLSSSLFYKMTLTVCTGSSGSGKTTFLKDVYKRHKCTYIRQYHVLRPYLTVTKIPNFNPTRLPYWDIHVKEGRDKTIKVGGSLAGKDTVGLSGGQRKLLLFELIYQRTLDQSQLLIVLDEPFAGVTDDFVPFILGRLDEMRERHNLVLVTNDHIQPLTKLADNTITVSAIDRTKVLINDRHKVDRDKAILALSLGEDFTYKSSSADLRFFVDVEITTNGALLGICIFTIFLFGLFLLTFWNSTTENSALVIIASTNIVFFCVQPYNTALVDWRNAMLEEAEARTHASKSMNKSLKTALALGIVLLVSLVEFGCVNAVVDGMSDAKYWVAMFCDVFSLTFPLIAVSVYTTMHLQTVQLVGSLPFLLVIFFSTTFSPGSGVALVKQLRYLFPRFYFWCMLPSDVADLMEGCPSEDAIVPYLILSALTGVFFFGIIGTFGAVRRKIKKKASDSTDAETKGDEEFKMLQEELFGKNVLSSFLRHHSEHTREEDDEEEDTIPPV